MLSRWKERLAEYKERLATSFSPRGKTSSPLGEQSLVDTHKEVIHKEVSDLTHTLLHKEHSQQQKFAAAFCYGCFTVFCFPLMSAWMVAFDKDVMYWFGTYVFWWTLPIPFGFLFVFAYHLRRGKLRRGFILGSVIIPCVTFFLLGTSLRFKSEHLKDHLLSVDCQTFPIMKELENASKEADEFYDRCNPHGYDILFPACADFEKWRRDTDNERTWDYLQHLETNCLCTGFCKSGIKPIWTHTEEWSHDACSMCVITAIDSHIWRVGEQMRAVGVIIVVIFLFWHFFMEPSLKSLDHFLMSPENPWPNEYGSMSSPRSLYSGMPVSLPGAALVGPAVPVSFRPSSPGSLAAAPVGSMGVPPTLAIVDGPVVSRVPMSSRSIQAPGSRVRSSSAASPRSTSVPPVMTSMPVAAYNRQTSGPDQQSSIMRSV